jgi:hypothetical protein
LPCGESDARLTTSFVPSYAPRWYMRYLTRVGMHVVSS